MSGTLPRHPDAETLEQWRETRDLVKEAAGADYDEQIEPWRAVIREQCGALVSPFQLLISMSGQWGRLDEGQKMATIAAACDVHDERQKGAANAS